MLERLNASGFAKLESEWMAQCADNGDDFSNYATPSVELARRFCGEDPAPRDSGIFKLPDADAFVHVTCARLPKTDGRTLRVLWMLLAPKFDYEDLTDEVVAKIATNLVLGSVLLSAEVFDAEHIKIHLGSAVDRNYFTIVAAVLESKKVVRNPEVKGMWLHFSRIVG